MQNDPMFVPGFSWKRSKSIVAFVTLVAFTVTTLVWDPRAFAGTGVPVAGEVSAFAQGVLQIPAELGQVTETLVGDPKAPAFIHIQSAHGNYSAEKNIEKLLGFIEKNSSVKLMLLEGASGKLHPKMFRMFPAHPEFNQKVTDKLVREGYLTGPESFLIGSDDKTEGWGIEDLEAYKKDRESFIHVVEKEKVAEKFLGSLRATIDRRFSSKLNKDLLNLVRQEEAFGSGTVSFEGWLTVLKAASQKHLTLDLSDAFYQNQYPFLIRYFRLQAIGSKIDREKARHEADAFLVDLASRKVSEEVLENFKAILQTSETELLRTVSRTTDGYSTLRRAFDLAFSSLPKDFSMTQWPNWTLYAQHIILMQEMEGKGLHEETLKLKDKIQTALAKTADEKAYLSQARELYLLRRLFNLELTRPEYEELAQTVKTSDTQEIQTLYKTAMDFYSTAVERENKMFQNALTKMAGTKQQHAVIVTGGFHAEGLKKLVTSKGCSYIQITPRIAEVSKRDHEVYLRSILGSRDVETSQMSALLGIVDRAQRVAVTGVAATKDWARDVRSLVLGLINSENVSARQALSVSFSNSIFGSQTPALVPVIARAEVREKQAATKVVAVDSQINSIAQKLTLAAALAFTSVSAHADSVGVLSSFSSEQSVSVWFWGSVLSLGALFAGYFIVWRLFFPINWHLRRLLSNEYAVRSRAIEKLVSIGSKAVPALIRILEDKTNISSSNVIEILERIKDARSIPGLIVGLGDKSEEIRFRSARALAEFADARIVPTLRKTADGWLQDLRKQRGELEETLKQTPSTIEQEETRQEELVELGGRGDRGGVYTIGYEIVPTGRMETVSNSAYTDLSWRISRLEVVEREIASFLLRAEEVNHVRSEVRLTPAQEKQFQKALRDLQPKWWDGLLGEIDGNERKKRALKTLGELKDSRSFRVLKEKILLHQEEPNFPSQQAVKSMKEFPTDMLLSGLMPFLGSEDERVGQNMVSIFEGLEDPAIVLPMIQALEGRDPRARERAASVLLGSRDFRSLDAFLRVLKNLNESAEMRRTAISAIRNWNPSDLGKERTTQWVEALISCLDNPPTRDDAARTLGDLKDRRAIKPLVDRLMTIDPSMLPPVFLFALRDLQWEPKNVNEAIRFACGLRSDATIWDKVALFGPAAVPLLMDLLISKDFELRRNVATVLLKIADPKLAGLDRYLEWTQDGTPPEQRKLIFLTPEKIETIKRAFAEGRTIQVEYEEQEMVSHQESYLDTYGQDYFYVVVDTPGYLSVKITGMGQEIGSVSVARTVGPAVTASPNGFPEPYAKDVGFWEFRLPVFNAASEGLSVTRLRDALEVLKNRGWLWSHFESTHRERVNQRATDRLEQLLSKVHAVMITLYANGILSAATPLVSLQLAGSYLWTDSPNDLDLVVIVEGERNFEKMSASNHTNGFLPVIPGIETSYEVVGLETLRRAVGGDEVKDANVIRRKAIMYSVSVPLAGIDLFASQSIPFDSYVTMRNDLMTDASRAAWRDLKGDPAKIAAKRLWRQEESDAMEKWLAMQRRLISEGSTEELRKMHERLSQIDSLILAAEANLEEEKSKLARLRQQDVSFDAGASRSEASQKQTLRSEVRTQLGAEDYAAANGVFSYLAEQSQDIPMNPDVLIVLGNPDHEVNGTAAAALYHRLNPKWVLVAGKGKKDRPEAHEFRDVLVARGVPGDKIFIEDQSMNTGQNAQFGSKLLREAMENRDPDMLNRPITAVVTQKPMGQRLSTDIMEKQFAWPQGISFFPSAPRVPQVNGQTDNEEFFQLVAEALDQIRRFPDFARQKFIDPKAAQHPNEVTQAVGRLTALMQSRSETRLTLHQADDSGEQEKQFQKALRNFQLFSWKKVVPIVFYVGIHVGGFLLVLSFIVSYFDLDLKSLQDRYWLVLMGSPSFLMTVMFLRSLPGLLRQIPSVNDHIAGRQAEEEAGAESRSESRLSLTPLIGLPAELDLETLAVRYGPGVSFLKAWEKTMLSETPAGNGLPLWKSMAFAAEYMNAAGEVIQQPDLEKYYDPSKVLYHGHQGAYWSDPELQKLLAAQHLRPDVTVLPAGVIGREFLRTEGHHHLSGLPEVYETAYGTNGYLLFKTVSEDSEDIADVMYVMAEAGDHVLFPPGYQHISINTGSRPFVMTDWVSMKANSDFKYIKRHHGAPYLVVRGPDGQAQFERNAQYPGKVPPIRLVRPADEIKLGDQVIFKKGVPMFDLVKNGQIDLLAFLNDTNESGRYDELYKNAFRSESRLSVSSGISSDTDSVTGVTPAQEKQFQKATRNFQFFSWKRVLPIVLYVGIHVGGFLLVLSLIVSNFDLDLKSLQDRYWLVLMGSPSFLMTVMFLRSLPDLLRQMPSNNDHITGRQAEGEAGAKSRSEVRWTDSEERQFKEVLTGHQEGLPRGKFVMELLLAGMIGMISLVSRAAEAPRTRGGFTSISNPLFLKGLENVKGTYENASIENSTEIRAKGSVATQSFSSQRVDQETLHAHVADIPSLLESLYHEDSWVREQALTALRTIKTESVVTGLLKSLDDKTGLNVAARARVIQTLSEMDVLEAVPVFIRIANDPTELRSIQDIALLAIYSVRNPVAAPDLVKALSSDDAVLRFFILKALSEMPAVSVTEALKEGLHNPDPRIAESSFVALVQRGKIYEVNDPALVPFLKKMMAHGEFSYRHFAADALYRISKIQYYQAAYGPLLKEIIKMWAGIFAFILTPFGVARVLKKIQLHHYRERDFYASHTDSGIDFAGTVDKSAKYPRSESRNIEETRPGFFTSEIRSEMRWDEAVVTPRVLVESGSGSLAAKIGTAARVAANTVSPLLSSSPVYASEIAPQLFAGTEHYQSVPEIPGSFTAQWPVLGKIVSGSATASAERLVIDQRHGIPDKESVLPLVAFARYNPKTTVVLALIATEDQVSDFQKAVAALHGGKAWPQNLKVRAFADENAFIPEFNGFYNASAPLGRPVALVTDQEGSLVTGKIGFRRSLLSVVGDRDSLKQTASVLLAADKLLDESVWSLGYHFVSVDKLGGLEMLMTELTNFIRSEARMAASA